MNFRTKMAAAILGMFVSFLFPAEAPADSSSEKALEILKKSNEKMFSLNSYVAEQVEENPQQGTKTFTVSYVLKRPDGVQMMRVESRSEMMGKTIKSVFIQNDSGYYQLYDHKRTAVLSSFVKKIQSGILSGAEQSQAALKEGVYSLSERTISDIPVYVVGLKYSEEQMLRKKELTLKGLSGMNVSKEMLDKIDYMTPVLHENYIRKDDFVNIGLSTFNKDGVKITSNVYQTIKLDVPVSADLFVIPENYKKIKVDDPSKLAEITIEMMR